MPKIYQVVKLQLSLEAKKALIAEVLQPGYSVTMRKKILYVITKSVQGGAQKYVYDLAANLPTDRFEAAVVTGGRGPLVEKLERAGTRTIILPTIQERGGIFEVLFSFVNIKTLFALVKIFRTEKPDVIHLNSSKIGGLGGLAARIASVINGQRPKVVFTVHGWPFNESRPWWQRYIIFFLSWLSTLFTNQVILINTADYHAALKFIPRRKCKLIFNGIKVINFVSREESRLFFSKKIGRPVNPETTLVGTIAELTGNKALPALIAALSKLSKSDFNSLIIGEGNQIAQLQSLIESLNLSQSTFLTGPIPDASRYLKGFDIFVLPSLKEGLPYTIMEAMVAGLPVVATRVGGIPDLIEHEKEGIIVPPGDQEAIHKAIAQLVRNKALREQLGKNGVQKIKQQFSLLRMIQKTTDCYEKT